MQMHTLRNGRRVRTLRGVAEEVFGKLGRKIVLTLQMVDMVSQLALAYGIHRGR